MILLREFIKSCLFEARKSNATAEERLQNEIDTLKKYVDSGYFFHMTDEYRLQGVNIKTKYTTPIGIYFFPLTQEFFEMILKGSLPFAETRQHILIYKLHGNIVLASEYTWRDFAQDYEDLNTLNNKDVKKLHRSQAGGLVLPSDWDVRINHPMSALLYLVYDGEFDSRQDATRATKNLLKLGYNGLCDDLGLGIIHSNEPTQTVMFGSKYCELIDTVRNPFVIKRAQEDNKLKKITRNFLNMSEDEQVEVLNSLDIEQIRTLLDNLTKKGNKLILSNKVQQILYNIRTFFIMYLQNISSEILEKISNEVKEFVLTSIFHPVPDEILQYFLDNDKEILFEIQPTSMSAKFRYIMKEKYMWDDKCYIWVKKKF